MNKSYYNKTIPLSLSFETVGSNLLTEVNHEPFIKMSEEQLRLNMKRNILRHNFGTIKSCLDDLKWIFEECQQFIQEISPKDNKKLYALRFNNLIKELQNL